MNLKTINLKTPEITFDSLNNGAIGMHSWLLSQVDRKDEDGYSYAYKWPYEKIFKEEEFFEYRINSSGFRGNHFKKLNQNDINIAYAGCSFTFGEGLPEHLIWPELLSKKIQKYLSNKNVRYVNLSLQGASIHQIVRSCFDYFDKYGNPDYLFLMLPDVYRGLSWVEDGLEYRTAIPDISQLDVHGKYFKNLIPENMWLLASDLINMLEQYCKTNNIFLLWDSWANHEFWQKINHSRMIKRLPVNGDLIRPQTAKPISNETFLIPNENNLPYWFHSRDGEHPGSCWTTYQANNYFSNIKFKSEHMQ